MKKLAEGYAVAQPQPYLITWNGADNAGTRVPSGVYFCTMTVNGNVCTRAVELER